MSGASIERFHHEIAFGAYQSNWWNKLRRRERQEFFTNGPGSDGPSRFSHLSVDPTNEGTINGGRIQRMPDLDETEGRWPHEEGYFD